MIDRVQLNLRLDGRRDLLESCKEVAANEGLSLNAWVIKQLELGAVASPKASTVDTTRQLVDTVVDTTRQPLDTVVEPLDKMLDIKEAIEQPGKLHLCEGEVELLRQEVHELRSQLETESADREQVEAELAELKQKLATASKNLPEAADLLNQLKARRKKSKADLVDLETILEILEDGGEKTLRPSIDK